MTKPIKKEALLKRSVSFELASECFSYYYVEKRDNRQDYQENRYQVIGRTKEPELILFVVYTPRNNKIRIISARKANKEEKEIYYEYYLENKK